MFFGKDRRQKHSISFAMSEGNGFDKFLAANGLVAEFLAAGRGRASFSST